MMVTCGASALKVWTCGRFKSTVAWDPSDVYTPIP